MKNKITILDGNPFNLDQIEGKFAAFERIPYAVTLRLSKPLAANGYGVITVNNKILPEGKAFVMNVMVKMYCLMVSVGSAVHEYNTEYTLRLSGFVAEDGSKFPDTTLKFKTLPRSRQDSAYAVRDNMALQAAREGVVLLQNKNNVLPLPENATLNCFGAAQYIFRNTATGAGLINPRWQANFHQSVREHSNFQINPEISALYRSLEDVLPSEEVLQRAKACSDTALILLTRGSGEFLDNRAVKGGYYLTDSERSMIQKVSSVFSRTVAILNVGYPIEMTWVKEYGINAVLYTGFAGMGAGYALMEILDGRTNPSGKLTCTWPFDYYDIPAAHNFINLPAEHKQVGEKEFGVHLYYEEDIYVGYRYFDTFAKQTAYGFGHGESYTSFSFAFSPLHCADDKWSVNVTVTNTGKRTGKEVVQLYVQAPTGKLEKPLRVLSAFEKTRLLLPGESQTLKLTAEPKAYASYSEELHCYLLEAGKYVLWCGNSLNHSERIGTFELENEQILEKVHCINPPVENFRRLTLAEDSVGDDSEIVLPEQRIAAPALRPVYHPEPLPAYHGKKITFRQLKANPTLLNDFVAQMTTDELCKLNVSNGAEWYLPWQSGAAGRTAVLQKYRIPKLLVSDGNTGLNLKKRNIGFPSSCTIAASFNRELAYNVGKTIAAEAVDQGIGINLGPAMNIQRNPLNGRHPEYFSEDPYLTGEMAGNHGKGLEENGCGCTYKHLFCNNSETSRKASHSIVSERALREIYFRTFQFACQVHRPTAVMTSYNAVNGIYPAENANILQTLLRKEWGLDSLIMTDWNSYDTVDPVEMVKAGNCWLTEGGRKYVRILQNSVKQGILPRAVLEQNVCHVIKAILRWAR